MGIPQVLRYCPARLVARVYEKSRLQMIVSPAAGFKIEGWFHCQEQRFHTLYAGTSR